MRPLPFFFLLSSSWGMVEVEVEAGVGVEAEAGEARTRPEEERGVRGRSVARSSQKSRCISSSVTSSRHASLSDGHKTRAVRAAVLPPSKDL